MPVICTSSRKPSYQPITYRILQRKQEENKHDPDTLKTFSVRASETSSLSSASKSLVGTAVPNSTAKERLSRRARVSIKPDDESILSISPKLQELQQLHNQLTRSSYIPVTTTKDS
ncbi:unnamed protein product [Acanthoscelides obtectus]|uniref:Uncharacterized protein n=1 Tax=Acanthoscelides obtectus TaxID=200917 RepID=A0A9P0K6S9_ACAOB|nr:unnamed protein product [Acanthoscelides obtectus]CAK1626759.1 hypothetical protein AOBTE_LOCUS4060 [Acanthoscelides obtectus]